MLFEQQSEWSGALDALRIFEGYAGTLGLDVEQFRQDMQDEELRERALRGLRDGAGVGVRGTPTFFVNGEHVGTPQSIQEFSAIINQAIEGAAPSEEVSDTTQE